MLAAQKSFSQKLSGSHGNEVRRTVSFQNKSGSISGCSSSMSLNDMVEPPDWEELSTKLVTDRDPLAYPSNDLEVSIVPRRIRTIKHVMPEEDLCDVPLHVRECVRCHTSDWIAVDYHYRTFSGSCVTREKLNERHSLMQTVPRQDYEVDIDPQLVSTPSEELTLQGFSQPSSGRQSVSSISSVSSCNDTLTPRGSWASLDLRSSSSDPLLPDLLERRPPDQLDQINEQRRMDGRRGGLLGLYASYIDDEEAVEKRTQAESPGEIIGHRILVKCLHLRLELEVEPIFASMALYDAKERKKVSENFYFDMNSENIKQMLSMHIPKCDVSTLSRSAVFDITHPTPDLFLVIRLEKVLQGDITECVEPYIKDDKNREKVKLAAMAACERLGKYRMPFAWTAIYLMNVINGSTSLEREHSAGSDRDSISSSSQSNSLDRKCSAGSLEQLRRQGGGGSLCRRGSLERRAMSYSSTANTSTDDLAHSLTTFKPITITVNNFFKQENDRLRDDDLYKFLQELKRPTSSMKKLKNIPGILKLEISPCSEDIDNGLTPELAKLHPYADNANRPCKELLPFPLVPMLVPHYQYRNLLYVYPKDLNFTAFTSRTGSARNIAVRVQLMCGEDQSQALNAIFGRSSCLDFTSEMYTTVTYHNKCPSFYDEIKIKLPANLGDHHHLLFTFYHISCQRKPVTAPEQEKTIETPVGYTWLPMCRSGRLTSGEHNLPVMLESPPPNYSFIFPEVLLPGTKWIDNHRAIFTISLEPISSVNPMDSHMERFIMACEAVQEGVIPPRIGLSNMEAELRNRYNARLRASDVPEVADYGIHTNLTERFRAAFQYDPAFIIELPNAGIEALVKSLPVLLDKLILLLVMPPSLSGQQLNIAQDVFCCLTQIFTNLTSMNDGSTCDSHGRSPLLGSYIQYQCLIPRPAKAYSTSSYTHPRSPSHHLEFASSALQIARNKSGEMMEWCTGSGHSNIVLGTPCKVLHEELSLQWVVASGTTRDLAMQNSWTLFELMIKSMVEQLWWNGTLEAPRKTRFSDQYLDDITTLVNNITAEIISRYGKDVKLTHSLNDSLAFFLFDLLSIVDRGFVFGLIRTYYKQMSAKISSLPDAMQLVNYKISFLRIVCSHEHYISLNLPCGTPYTGPVSPSSPSPSTHSSHSTHSTHSHSSNVSYQLSSGERGCYSELSPEYRHQHFLVGLLLSELSSVLDIHNPLLQGKAVCAILSLLTSHDTDSRFSQPEVKARVAGLYIPLLAIVMDSYPQLYRGFLHDKDRAQLGEDNLNSLSYSGLPSPTDNNYEYKKNVRAHLNSETTRNLLMCFVWVLKSVDKAAITKWCGELQPDRIHTLLQVLSLCFACFEYKGKKEIQRCAQQNVRKTTDIKSRLEDVILGQGSARSEMMMRRKGCHSTMTGEKRERWRKEWVKGGGGTAPTPLLPHPQPPPTAPLPPSHLEGALAADVSLTVLHTLETIVQVASAWDSHHSLFSLVLRVLLLGLAKNQSTNVLQHMFATQRSLVFKFHWLVFDSETEQCGELCLVLLRHCGALCGAVRAHASATLYLLMRQNYEIGNNFARVKMQVTMSLSSLVGTSATFSEDSLRRALKTILLYAEQDTDLQDTSFPEQVKDLVFNLHMILSDTVKMKEFQEDPEMLLDLMHRIAKGYQNSPDLRLTWLANMAQKHMERLNHTEAGMCLVHSAALVAEYLVLLGAGGGGGAVALQKVTPNALHESAVSDDVMAPRNEGICLGKDFTELGLQGLLEHAANCFHTAGMYEAMNDVYKVLLPIAETNRDYKKLANIHGKLNEAYTRIEQLSGKRVFGTYFRVGFYGSKFGDLNGEEFIYKEPTLTKLPEIFSRLENFYGQRFGPDNIVIIKDSNTVDTATLDPEKAYIQITYVEPYFEPYELRYRLTHFEKNFNIKRFIYATPFTTSGRAHGDLIEQCKRKTILTTAHHFPYVKTRIQVVQRTQIVLSPIEVAIEDIQKKINELAAATNQDPPDTKMLQMVVQGCIGTTVNQGPMEMALVFLSGVADGSQPPTKLTNKLRLCFKDFSKKCHDALKKNKNLIGNDQKEYQKELERNYQRLTERLSPLIQSIPGHVAQLSNGSMKPEWRYHT